MALSVKDGHLRLDDIDEVRPPSWATNLKRRVTSHLAAILFTAVLTGGLSLQDKAVALKEAQSTFEQLAVYSGCAARDQLGGFYWHDFPMPQAAQEADTTTAPLAKRAAKRR